MSVGRHIHTHIHAHAPTFKLPSITRAPSGYIKLKYAWPRRTLLGLLDLRNNGISLLYVSLETSFIRTSFIKLYHQILFINFGQFSTVQKIQNLNENYDIMRMIKLDIFNITFNFFYLCSQSINKGF